MTDIISLLHSQANLTYSEISIGKSSRTSIPNDNPDINRLLDNNPECWITSQGHSQQRKRIILSDWSVRYHLVTSDDITKLCRNLLDNKFEIFAAIDGFDETINLELITESTLANAASFIDILNKITPIHPDDLEQKLVQKGIMPHDSKIVTCNETYELLNKLHLKTSKLLSLEPLINFTENESNFLCSTLKHTDFFKIKLNAETLTPIQKKNLNIIMNKVHTVKLICSDTSDLSFISESCQKNLKSLYVLLNANIQFTGLSLLTLHCPKLTHLSFYDTTINDKNLSIFLQHTPLLEQLDVSYCEELTGTFSDSLPPTIQHLNLNKAGPFTDEVLIQIFQKLPALKILGLNNQMPNSSEPLKYVPHTLETIFLSENMALSHLGSFFKSAPSLKNVTLDECDLYGEEFKFLPNVDMLFINNCPIIDALLIESFSYMSQLKTLKLLNCNTITGEFLAHLPTTLQSLFVVYEHLEVDQMRFIFKRCPDLKKLNLSGINKIDELIPESMPELEELILNRTEITEKTILLWLKQCPKLKSISLKHCYNMTWNFLKTPLASQLISINGLIPINTQTYHEFFLDKTKLLEIQQQELSAEVFIREDYLSQKKMKKNTSTIKNLDQEKRLDKETTGKHAYKITQVYRPKSNGAPNVIHYRNLTYDCINVNVNTGDITASTHPFNDTELKSIDVPNSDKHSLSEKYERLYEHMDDTFLGRIIIPKGSNGWIKLTGLSPNDEILDIESFYGTSFDVKRDPFNGYFYIKSQTLLTKDTPFSWILKTKQKFFEPVSSKKIDEIDTELFRKTFMTALGNIIFCEALKKSFITLNDAEKITVAQKFFLSFHDNALKLKENATDIDIANAMFAQKCGVCRHRTLLAKKLLETLHVRPIFIDESDPHSYLSYQGEIIDLGGGGDVTLEIIPAPTFPPQKILPILEAPYPLSPENPYKTWEFATSKAINYKAYIETLLNAGDKLGLGKKNVLSLLKPNQIEALHTEVLKKTQQEKRGFFYVSHLDELRPKTHAYDAKKDDCLKVDTKLAIFLKNAQKGDVLMVNWSDYQMKHVGHNELIDSEQRMFGHIKIPDGVIILNVLDEARRFELREDFYSRNRYLSNCPANLCAEPLPYASIKKNITDEGMVIPFYDNDWEKNMLGQFTVNGSHYRYKESEFIEAIRHKKSPIILKNAPWDLEDFRLFINELLLKKEVTLEGNGEKITLPANFEIIRDDTPFKLDIGHYHVNYFSSKQELPKNTYILNIQTEKQFFSLFEGNQTGLIPSDGILKSHAHKTCVILLTERLPEPMLAKFLAKADELKITLNFILAPGVHVPKIMQEKGQLNKEKTTILSVTHPDIFLTQDVDIAEEIWREKNMNKRPLIIPVHEGTTYADLIEQFPFDTTTRKFSHKTGILSKGLQKNRPVLLKGTLSPILAKQLESFFLPEPYYFLNGQRKYMSPHQITLVTEVRPVFSCITPTVSESMSPWDKLNKNHPDDKNILIKLKALTEDFCKLTAEPPFRYAALKVMLQHAKKYPEKNPLKPFLRLKKNYSTDLKQSVEKLWKKPKKDKRIEKDAAVERLNTIEGVLELNHYAFIAGLSGVGKSSFIQKELKNKYGKHIHIVEGMHQLNKWIEDAKKHPSEKSILFIDEANLYTPGVFDKLEGFFNTPKRILENGRWKKIPDNCYLMFGGNFGHFSGRQQHSIFEKHGQITVFKTLPKAFIKTKILTPLMNALFPKNLSLRLAIEEKFLTIFEEINSMDKDKIWLTPRNLQMMALRFHHFLMTKKMSQEDALMMAVYDEVSGALPKNLREQWLQKHSSTDNNNENLFKDVKPLKKRLKKEVVFKDDIFVMTKSRQNPIRLMHQLFDIRDMKMPHPSLYSAGVCGILLENPPGTGKSEIAMRFLKSRGYSKVSSLDDLNDNNLNKIYLSLKPTNPEDMEKALNFAFKKGIPVEISEYNTLPLEHLMNAFASGVDLEGNPPEKPGFFIIASQNPKRLKLSDAAENRFAKIDLRGYLKDELIEIIEERAKNQGKEIPDRELVEKRVDYFFEASTHAKQTRKHPEPTIRDLLNDDESTSHKK